ncbi:sulfotransferase domain-containing protein [uncultured Jatrophihabitans sp.]|uniref:sulfotransferase domain-containing protein n=1 Tax=uncultured Jatrophihabitans sp. TaxID=1610747 RepID=UPI0035CBAFF8
MNKIVWLASYPKSGNTWTRVFLANYLRDAAEPVDVNDLDGDAPIASHRLGFDECVGIEASQLPPRITARLRPEVYRTLAREASELLFMKAHDAWTVTDIGTPMFPTDVTAAVVYLLRNPLDVAVSFAHHGGRSTDSAVANMCDTEFTMSESSTRLSYQLPQRIGTWSEHVRSWVDDSGLPICIVRYEDLRADAITGFGRILDFVGVPVEPVRLRRAVESSRLEELQRQEAHAGFRERPPAATAPFFRRGEVGSGRHELAGDLIEKLTDAHRETMQRFGYIDEET